ncbi:MAG: DNA replication and repair protein RecF [Fusobacteriia bacterium 4572_74]|nr:MAG: DNA replication and repair protein RecF [Fusobacteriia bacterium 4572_74]
MQILDMNMINFRNLDDEHLEFDRRFNLFLGKNGQGKTSILEAVYFTVTGKSFRTSKNKEMIKYGHQKMGAFVNYEDRIARKSISVKVDEKKKIYSYNRKSIKYDEFLGKLNIISFIPEDIELIIGSPSVRRSFFDYEIAQADPEYYLYLKSVSKLLKFRNKYLKDRNTKNSMFEIYNLEFIKYASLVVKKRIDYVKNVSRLLSLNYRKLFDGEKELTLGYKSFLGELRSPTLEEIEGKIRKSCEEVRDRELRYGYSLVGPQRDDFIFLLENKEAKSYSSQGEKKSIVFALKISEIDMIIKEKKEIPVFIIDDISSYFDSIRKENILKYFQKREIQLFISSTSDLEIEAKRFHVHRGEIDG